MSDRHRFFDARNTAAPNRRILGKRMLAESNPLPNISRNNRFLWAAVVLCLLVVISVLDRVTDPRINLSVAFFVPIVLAAWALGRPGAVAAALIAEIPTYMEQTAAFGAAARSNVEATSTIVVHLLIYLFVAEVTVRLMKSREEAQTAAAKARALALELQTAYSRLDEDVRAGGTLQASALRFAPPTVPGCEVGARVQYARAVGGDFADAAVLNGHVYACVGDISGKGTPAALFSMLFKHLLDSAHRRGLCAREVVTELDRELSQGLPDDRFVTFFYVEIDPGNGLVEYVNAGHPEGILFRHSSRAIELLGPNVSLLGCSEVPTAVTTSTIRLQPGDVLVLYTDGATESRRPDRSRLGDVFMIDLVKEYGGLAAQEMADTIVRRVEEATEAEWRDDLTVLCIKATEPGQGTQELKNTASRD